MNKIEKLKKNTRKEFLLIIKEQEEEIEYIFEEAAKEIEKNQNKISDIAALLLFLKKEQRFFIILHFILRTFPLFVETLINSGLTHKPSLDERTAVDGK